MHVNIIKEIAKGIESTGALNRYLELGIRKGRCFNIIAPMCKEAYAVDIDAKGYKHIKHNENIKWKNCSTDTFFENYDGEMFDLAFIDANHNFLSSWYDFQNSMKIVNINGIIILHDTYPYEKKDLKPNRCSNSWETALKIKNDLSDECEIVTLPFDFGISVVRKISKNKQLTWM